MAFWDNKQVTVINRSMDPKTEKETYYVTLIERADLVRAQQKNVSAKGTDSADAATLYVSFGNMPKLYVTPEEWKRLPEEKKKDCMTFSPAEDFFILGNCTGAILPDKDVYQWAKEHYSDVYRVTRCNIYEDVLAHYEVGGA
uniref:Uncharacterized protein n=1 Tax=Myoviridae sp. ctq9w2 TaxID=2825177 RepID=A0A8S5PWA4_9CAUD|nr:MAG TPA: hypothetical protein [Myoviridae sp. ctq9w2]DAZ48108.1 MAG TPA: hypothetical protein [Caudoviricetes sp.]